MLTIVLVEITDMRVQSVAIEIHVRFRIACCEPGVLYRNVRIFRARRQSSMFRFLHPVVTVVADRANQLVLRHNFLDRG